MGSLCVCFAPYLFQDSNSLVTMRRRNLRGVWFCGLLFFFPEDIHLFPWSSKLRPDKQNFNKTQLKIQPLTFMHGKSMVKKVPLMTELRSSVPEFTSQTLTKLRFWYFLTTFLQKTLLEFFPLACNSLFVTCSLRDFGLVFYHKGILQSCFWIKYFFKTLETSLIPLLNLKFTSVCMSRVLVPLRKSDIL